MQDFLFLGRAVDSTLLLPISSIAPQSVNLTKDTMKQTQQLLEYIATQEEEILMYRASDMKLAVHINDSYLIEPKLRSRAGGHLFYPTKQQYHKTTAQLPASPT